MIMNSNHGLVNWQCRYWILLHCKCNFWIEKRNGSFISSIKMNLYWLTDTHTHTHIHNSFYPYMYSFNGAFQFGKYLLFFIKSKVYWQNQFYSWLIEFCEFYFFFQNFSFWRIVPHFPAPMLAKVIENDMQMEIFSSLFFKLSIILKKEIRRC